MKRIELTEANFSKYENAKFKHILRQTPYGLVIVCDMDGEDVELDGIESFIKKIIKKSTCKRIPNKKKKGV